MTTISIPAHSGLAANLNAACNAAPDDAPANFARRPVAKCRERTQEHGARGEVTGVELRIERLTKRLARDETQNEGGERKLKREGA
jgi:hypothetical protein